MMVPVHRTELFSMTANLAMRRFVFASMVVSLWLFSTLLTEAQGELSRYPGSPELRSPTGQYVISSLDDEKLEPSHVLVVHSTRTKEEKFRIPYARYVEVAWSPDGNSLAVNDHGGSTYTDCKIISLGQETRSIEVSEQLRAKINPPSMTRNHHVFLECVEWLGNNKVRIKTHGYGDRDPKGFAESYVFNVRESVFEANAFKAQ